MSETKVSPEFDVSILEPGVTDHHSGEDLADYHRNRTTSGGRQEGSA